MAALIAFVAVGASSGCASMNPILTPARALPQGRVALDVGLAYNAPVVDSALGEARDANARVEQGSARAGDREALVRAALLHGGSPPGVGGYASARVGFGARVEGQLAYVGRVVRLGVRRVFWTDADERWAFSGGVQARVGLFALGLSGVLPGLSVSESRVFGGDVLAVFGRTNSELYDIYVGARAGYTYGMGVMSYSQLDAGAAFDASGHRVDLSVALGMRVGFGRIAATMELDATTFLAWGRASNGVDLAGAGFALIPAAGLSLNF